MIGVTMGGRLGNQFLMYALARKLMYLRQRQEQLVFDFSHLSNKKNSGFTDVLRFFQIQEYIYSRENLILKYGSIKQKFAYLRHIAASHFSANYDYELDTSRLFQNGIYFNYNNYPVLLSDHQNIFTFGLCETPACFDDIKEILQKEFTPKSPLLDSNQGLMDIIKKTNSVCVTIRRGDFLSDKFKKDFFLCDKDYFERGIEEIKKRVDSPVFIFFSDDIDWVKANFEQSNTMYFESGTDPVWEKIRLMYSCKHFIISNSTFSWWAQYLSRNPNKVVISPDKWFPHQVKNSKLIQEDFVCLQTTNQINER